MNLFCTSIVSYIHVKLIFCIFLMLKTDTEISRQAKDMQILNHTEL